MTQENQQANNIESKIKIPVRAFTHSGKFHADDVFSAALLTYLNPDIKIIRGYNIPEGFDGIVFDIGGGKYDHHQEDALVRDNNIPYAALGLIWKEFGSLILSEEDSENFDKSFIQPLDYSDNTGSKNELADIISVFNANWDDDVDSDICFNEAKEVALKILTKKIQSIKSINKAKEFVFEAIDNSKDKIMILSTRAPWKYFVHGTDIEFVVYPSDRGGYNAQAVPTAVGTTQLKLPFPEEWRGKRQDEIQKVSGIETLTFCHNSGFLISADLKEDVIKACKITQEIHSL